MIIKYVLARYSFIGLTFMGLGVSLAVNAEVPPPYVYVQGGTEGAGVGIGVKLNPSWVIRAEVNAIDRNKKEQKTGVNSSLSRQFRTSGVYVDYFPAEPSVRVTAGLMLNNTKYQYNAVAQSGGATLTLNDVGYHINQGESASVLSKASSVMPYIGVGYGHDEVEKPGINFHADVGVGIGREPSTRLTLNAPSLSTDSTVEANRRAQEEKIKSDLKTLKMFPVAKIGIGIAF